VRRVLAFQIEIKNNNNKRWVVKEGRDVCTIYLLSFSGATEITLAYIEKQQQQNSKISYKMHSNWEFY